MRWSKVSIVFGALATCSGFATALRGTNTTTPSFGYASKEVNHVLSTGQSLSVGSCGAPALSTRQPYANLMLEPDVLNGGRHSTRFVPLLETNVETMSSAFANLVTRMAEEDGSRHDLLVSVHGINGFPYSTLKKGTAAYEHGMAQVRTARELASAARKSYVVRAVTNVHGESDHIEGNADYRSNLLDWQRDYENDVRAATGQKDPVPMFITQMSTWTMYGSATSAIPVAQLEGHLAAPGKVILVGPKYHLPYAPDGVHLTNEGYRHMGEDYAKAYRRVVLEGRTWEPVRPKQITRSDAVLTVVFHVPSPPLVFDTARVSNPGAYGFRYVDDSGAPPAIAHAAVTAPDTVTIWLAAPPTGANARLHYAFTGTAGARGGPTSGARGNLRDSDTTPSRSGNALYNWCVHFDEAVPAT
jgi:hypothetical protein